MKRATTSTALDAAVDVCRKYEMPVYVIGVPAPFGRETAYVKYVDPDPNFDQSPQWAPVHQGPESLLPERIMLLFGGTAKSSKSKWIPASGRSACAGWPTKRAACISPSIQSQDGQADSAVGNGRHVVAPCRSFFDPRVMRNYRPDYVPSSEYYELVKSNARVRGAGRGVAAFGDRRRWKTCGCDSRASTTPNSPATCRTPSGRRPSSSRRSNALVAILRQGERDRDKITTPRWQAGFDLAIGRALAVNVRTEGYNAMLAEAKQGLKFKDEQSDTWELRPSISVTDQQRTGQGRGRRQEVSGARRGRAPRNALGDGRRQGAASSRSAGNGTKRSPTWPAASPRPKRTEIARGPNVPSRRESRAAIRRRCSSLGCDSHCDAVRRSKIAMLPTDVAYRFAIASIANDCIRIVPVEVHRDLVRDDLDELALELLHRLVLGRDAAVDRVQALRPAGGSHTSLLWFAHVVHGHRHIRTALVQRLAFVQSKSSSSMCTTRSACTASASSRKSPQSLSSTQLSTSRGLTTSMSFHVLDQQLADALAKRCAMRRHGDIRCDDGGRHITTTRWSSSASHSAGTMLPPSQT